jgi:hypothetical protein
MGETYRARGYIEDYLNPILGTFLPGPRSSCYLECDITKAYDFGEVFYKFATTSGSSKTQKIKKDTTISAEVNTLMKDAAKKAIEVKDVMDHNKEPKTKSEPTLEKLNASKILSDKKLPEDKKKTYGGEKIVSNKESALSLTNSVKEAISEKKSSSALIENEIPKNLEKEKIKEAEENSDFDSEEERKTLLKLKEFLRGYYLDSWGPS